MVVAVVAVGMVQVAIDQIVHVITVWHGFVSATGTVNMIWIMRNARMTLGALIGIR